MSLFEINLLAEIFATGSDSRSGAFQLMSTISQTYNDNGRLEDEVFRGKRGIRTAFRCRNKSVGGKYIEPNQERVRLLLTAGNCRTVQSDPPQGAHPHLHRLPSDVEP